MFVGRRAVRRFSLLLLEEGEVYIKDFLAHCSWPAVVPGNWQRAAKLPGQLRLCTKSLFFEPDDVRIPIVRLPFAQLQGLEGGAGGRAFSASALRVVRMRPSAADVPYAVDKDAPTAWGFELAYSGLEEFMPLAQQMLVASRMPAAEQEEFIEAFLAQEEAGLRFDAAHLRSPALETVAIELPATSLTPLVREPGRVVVSDARLYFQPQHNITGDTPVLTHPLCAVAAVARRRNSLRDVGVEVFFLQPGPDSDVSGPFWGAPSAFFALRSWEDREALVAAIMGQPQLGLALPGGRSVAAACGSILEAEGSWLRRVTAAWQRGHVSNFQYLLFCNLAAGRTFNDLSQYPVFPWVLADYSSEVLDLDSPASFRDLSQPVGALNPVRLAMFQRRYAEMPNDPEDPPFLYGTHYSCPGYVMFWLVRAAPAHMLRLQNGRFDAPDRLFCSIKESWQSVLANPTDVKELIPEFFMARPDFLENRHKLALGSRQNGQPVGDVELPPWAGGSAERFLEAQRAALEAPFVSANLHHWINLIFGYQQQGPAAVEANNVFRHLTYEGAVDTGAISDRMERISLQTQVNEFGQCPRQLFRQPHPPRLVCPPAPPLGEVAGQAGAGALRCSSASLGGSSSALAQQAAGADGGGQALSLALVSTLVAAASESDARPPPLEVPSLLLQLDVVRQRKEQEARELAMHGPVVSRATVIVEEFESGNGSSGQGAAAARSSAGAASAAPAAGSDAAAGRGGAPASAYSRLRSWANEHGAGRLGERLGALKGALGEVAAAPSGDRASSLRGLFKRGSGGSSSSLLGQQGVVVARSANSDESVGRPGSASSVDANPVSPGGSRVSSFTASLSQRLHSFASNLSSPERGGARGAGPAAAPQEPLGNDTGATGAQAQQHEDLSAVQDVLAGLMRWKVGSARQPLPADDSSDDEEADSDHAGEGAGASRESGAGTSQAAGELVAPRSEPGAAGPAGAAESTQQQVASPRQQLLEAQRQRMLRERAASPPHERRAAAAGEPGLGALGGQRLREQWGAGLRDRLHLGRVFAAGGEALNSVAAAEGGGTYAAYCVGHGGAIKLFDLKSGNQLRSTGISSQPLACLALLPSPQPGSGAGGTMAALPLALCGSYDSSVYAYSVELGRVTGSFQAHNDTVSCLAWLGSGRGGGAAAAAGTSGGRLWLLTGSWDATVRVWDLGEGRQPWGSRAPGAAASAGLVATLSDLPGGVWALAAGADDDNLVLTGTEDGHVSAWDLRSAAKSWEQPLSQDYVGGLQLTPDGSYAVVAAADGNLFLLDLRRGGVPLSCVACGPPLRCVATDGELALAGAEDGTVFLWDVGQQRGRVPQAGAQAGAAWTPPGPDGLYEPLRCSPPSPVNALAVGWLGPTAEGGRQPGAGRGAVLYVVTGHEAGVLRSFVAQG